MYLRLTSSVSAKLIVMIITPLQWALLLTALVIVILMIIKDRKTVWIGSSLAVMTAQIFLSIHTYCNSFNVVFRRNDIYGDWLISNVYETAHRQSRILVWAVLFFDVLFIFLFCMHFIRNHKMGVIHLIAALAASIGTRIAGYYSTVTPPSFAFNIFRLGVYDDMLCWVRKANPTPLKDKIVMLTTASKITGMIFLLILFVSLITLCLRAGKRAPGRKKLFLFPLFIFVIELIRYLCIALCEFYYDVFTDFRFGMISLFACIVCLATSLYLYRASNKILP